MPIRQLTSNISRTHKSRTSCRTEDEGSTRTLDVFRAVCFQSGAVTGQSLEAAALNADGVPDFVGGAEDGHLYYMRNPKAK